MAKMTTHASSSRNWGVGYTRHPGRWDRPESSIDFLELISCSNGNKLKTAFLTTFEPWTLSFLVKHFGNTPTTLFVGDESIADCDCDVCERELRVVAGLVWTCAECQYDVCSECAVRKDDDTPLSCPTGHDLQELFPALFEPGEGARVINACYNGKTGCYNAEVHFDDEAPHRFQDGGHLQVVIPRQGNTFCVHPKMMVLNFGEFVRIVISSFNMSEVQWSEAGDVFWWADLPLSETPYPHLSRTGREPNMHAPLYDFLCCIGARETADLLDYADWRSLRKGCGRATGLYAIASIPGEHYDSRFGLRRLGDVLGPLGHLPRFPTTGSPIHMQVWSMGGSAPIWYMTFVSVLTQKRRGKVDVNTSLSVEDVHFIVQTPGNGGCSSFDARMVTRNCLWEDPDHPLTHVSEDTEEQPPVTWGWHSKVMYRMYPQGTCGTPECTCIHGWAYVGSHNCSASSWGRFVQGGKTRIQNFELGVVVTSLPAIRRGAQCGICLLEAAPIPWSSIASLVPYSPCPLFVRKSVRSVVTLSGVVVCEPNLPPGRVAGKAHRMKFENDPDSDSDTEDADNDEQDEQDADSNNGSEDDEEKSHSFKFRYPILKSIEHFWPTDAGTPVTFDYSSQFGIVHIY